MRWHTPLSEDTERDEKFASLGSLGTNQRLWVLVCGCKYDIGQNVVEMTAYREKDGIDAVALH